MTDQDHLDRINALTANARNTWFVLLAALVFVGITLMGVEHIDFYGVDRATTLPVVNVEVPTRFFFIAAPILIAAVYGYFHLYLIRLWDALGTAPARINGIRLGNAIAPWLVSDAALHLRTRMRQDNSTTPRALESAAMILNLLLAWGFGLFVLAALWWLSMPARTLGMTGIAGASLLISVLAGSASLVDMVLRLRSKEGKTAPRNIFVAAPHLTIMVAMTPFVAWMSYERSVGSPSRLAALDLNGENIVERPAGWLSYPDERAEFRADWCSREGIANCQDFDDQKKNVFNAEFQRRRAAALSDMRRPAWSLPTNDPTDMDLRDATLRNAFLAGVNLRGAQMEGANLRESQMERANLLEAQMKRADLREAQMERANLRNTQMEEADLREAQMERANLRGAQLKRANLSGAQMELARLLEALMKGANLSNAQMEGVDLSFAQMQGAVLSFAQMKRAMFDYSELTGTSDSTNFLFDTNLSESTNNGGMLRFVDMTVTTFDGLTDWRNVFLDGSVTVSQTFRTQMGEGSVDGPCQWEGKALTRDTDFYGRWRWWVEQAPDALRDGIWKKIAPDGFEDVPPNPGPEDCAWKIGPMLVVEAN